MARSSRADSGERKPSQRAMVQATLDAIGMDAKPLEMQSHIKEKYGIELPANIISNYKSQIKRKSGMGAGGPGRGRRGLQVEDFEVIRNLVRRLGSDQVKRMVEVVG